MKIIESIEEMREYSQHCKRDGKTISYVSSESYLHDGHMSLVKIAKENADITVLSAGHCLSYFYDINHPQRYKKYIIDYREFFLKQDIMICKENNVDVFFQPSMFDLYSNLTNKITLSSPNAFCNKANVTVESTPPDTIRNTFLFFTCSLIFLTLCFINESNFQVFLILVRFIKFSII